MGLLTCERAPFEGRETEPEQETALERENSQEYCGT